MPNVLPSQLMSSVMGKLYDVLTNGDDTVPQSEDNFFSWATPGIPVEPDDFNFLSQGLTGIVKREAVSEIATGSGGGAPELTPAMLDELRAQDTANLYMQAENFARLVDFVPDVTKAHNEQFARLSVMNNEGSLSDIYSYVLRMSQVMKTELDQETKKQIEEFRALLTEKEIKKNIVTKVETEVSVPSPLVQIYNQKLAAYEDAALRYNTARIDALTAADSRSVHYWAMNASILRNRVKAAMDDWVSSGYKNEYEQIAAFIDQVMRRDMSLLKREYIDDLEKARLTGLASGSDFFYTSLVPGNFATSSGWTEFRFTSGNFESHSSSSYSTKRWQASGGASWLGIFGGRGNASSSSSRTEYQSNFNTDHFSLSFQIAQVPIVRPWFKTAFLMSKSWRFDQNNPEAKSKMLSDGGSPPKGMMPAYPTSVIFIKNLKLSFSESSGFSNFMEQHTSSQSGGGGCVVWGPFFIGGQYSRSSSSGSSERNYGYKFQGQEMIVPGMQVVGFKCHILEKRPDPLPSITQWI